MNMFRTVFTVMRKELRDLSRDRRTLALALFLGPLLYPALMLGMGYLTENRIRTQVDKTLEIPMVGAEHAPNLVKFLATNGITAAPAPANLDIAIRSQEIDAALRIIVRDGVRAYEWSAIIRAINTVDVMTAEVPELDWELLKRMTDRITHEVPGICRVCYGLTPKPVGTVEWE